MSDEKQRGLYSKFIVSRRYDPYEKHGRCQYIVLDVTHDRNAHPALIAYADAVERDGYHALANDLRKLAFQNENMSPVPNRSRQQ